MFSSGKCTHRKLETAFELGDPAPSKPRGLKMHVTDHEHSKMSSRPATSKWQSHTLTRLGALAAVSFIVALALSPLTTVLSVLSPALYAVIASAVIAGPMLAATLIPRFGSAVFVALVTAAGLMAFTPLGPLAFLALGVPAIVMELVLFAGRALERHSHDRALRVNAQPPAPVWYLACAASGTTIGFLSLPIIAPEAMTPWLPPLVVALRVLSYLLVGWLTRRLQRLLAAAGV